MRVRVRHHLPAPIEASTSQPPQNPGPDAYDWFRLIFLREGDGVALSEFGEKLIRAGDIVIVSPNVLFEYRAASRGTVISVFIDHDYVVDQVFWQNSGVLHDKTSARELLELPCIDPAQVLRLSETDRSAVSQFLDELVSISNMRCSPDNVLHREVLALTTWRVVAPYLKVNEIPGGPQTGDSIKRRFPRRRRLRPIRAEALQARELMHEDLARQWKLGELAEAVHLSVPQLHRVFVDAYGQTPKTYLSVRRAEELARLLRETDLPVEAAMQQVGWKTRGHAARFFRQYLGVNPARYRQMIRRP
ncbi:helix-turn-helix transcriptional regulator [Brevibacterium paucivorans]